MKEGFVPELQVSSDKEPELCPHLCENDLSSGDPQHAPLVYPGGHAVHWWALQGAGPVSNRQSWKDCTKCKKGQLKGGVIGSNCPRRGSWYSALYPRVE